MSGTTTEWGDQPAVTSVQLTATNPDGSPDVIMPALQGPGQAPVIVPGSVIVQAAAALVPPGSVWHVVSAAPDASLGTVGDFAYLPATGAVYQKQNQTGGATTAVWVVVGNIQGAPGTDGTNGSSLLPTTGLPAAGVGADGDHAIDATTGALYLKSAGTWTLVGNLTGPAGRNGADGATGETGQPGPPIAQGPWTTILPYNAATNTPALSANGGGYASTTLLIVATAGTVAIDSVGAVAVGDALIGGGTAWTRITGFASPQAVAALTVAGALTLPGMTFTTTDDPSINIAFTGPDGEYTNFFHSDGSVSFAGLRLAPIAGGGAQILSDDGLSTVVISVVNGVVTVNATPTIPGSTFQSANIPENYGWGPGPDGEYIPVLDLKGNFLPAASASSSSGDFTEAEIAALDAIVLGYASLQNENARALTQPIVTGAVNLLAWYGQSLSIGAAGSPALSLTALSSGVVTCGTRLLFANTNGVQTPVTDGNFHPMVASSAATEIPLVCASFGLKFLDCAAFGLPISDTTRTIASNSWGIGGKTIELLSYGAPIDPLFPSYTQNYWTGLENGIAAEAAAAAAAGKDFYIPVFYYHQGEANYGTAGSAMTASAYAAKVLQMNTDFMTQIVAKYCPKQILPPLMILAQTGGDFIVDGENLGVSQGQILAASQATNIVCMQGCGNLQARSDQDGHPAVNAYRQHGNKIAQVIEQCVIKRKNWNFMHMVPELMWWRGSTVLVGIPPRKAPLQLASPFAYYAQVPVGTFPTLGFTATDSVTGSAISVVSAALAGQAVVQLTLGGTPANAPTLQNTNLAQFNGQTFLEDSDNQIAPAIGYNTYQYVSGMQPGENIPALIGTLYSMRNQFLLGCVTATPK